MRANLLCLFGVSVAILVCCGPAAADIIVTQNFDTNPGWTSIGSGSNDNNFGFQTSSFAGGSPGEAGGRFTRSNFVRSYADTNLGGSFDLGRSLQAFGKLDVTAFQFPDLSYGLRLGHFDRTTHASIGFIFNNTISGGLYVDAFIDFGDGTESRSTLVSGLLANVDRNWSYVYDPSGGVDGVGRLSVNLSGPDGGSTFVDLTPGDRLKGTHFNAFGLDGPGVSPESGAPLRPDFYVDLFIDDVGYSAVPEPSSLILSGLATICLLLAIWQRRSSVRDAI